MKPRENRLFLDFFDRNYARCYSYVCLSVADEQAVKSIISEAMKSLWNEHLLQGTSVNDLGRLVQLLDIKTRLHLLSRTDGEVKGYKSSSDTSSFTQAQIDSLPRKRREIFLLSRVEGLTSAQIASELSISPRTVEKHIELALKQLKKN